MDRIISELIKSEKIPNIEITLKNKYKKLIPISLALSSIKDHEGEIIELVGISRDISERKKAEEGIRKSESSIRNKLKAITEPEGDIGSLELSDIIETEVLQSIMEYFYQLTGIGGSIVDISGKVLIGIGWQDICTKFHRCHPGTKKTVLKATLSSPIT